MRTLETLAAPDGAVKHLIELDDQCCIEAVWIPQHQGTNLCVSCQVGCPNKCRHCATGALGFVRDLTSAEICEQVSLLVNRHGDGGGRIKVLFMGMGEPLLNYDGVMLSFTKMLRRGLVSHPADVIVSTVGIAPAIGRLAQEGVRPKLAVTVAVVPDGKRAQLIPTTKIFPLDAVLAACRDYQAVTSDCLIFEVPLISQFNDSVNDAIAIAELIREFDCEVQVVPFNPIPGAELARPSEDTISRYTAALCKCGMKVALKPSYGVEVSAGCGQLARTTPGNRMRT